MTSANTPETRVDQFARIRQAKTAEIADRRRRVLAHPDLAARLTERPLDYTKPEQWNGYIPPEYWAQARNNCPRRAALLQLLADVREREAGQ